jgi:hypothetical protein
MDVLLPARPPEGCLWRIRGTPPETPGREGFSLSALSLSWRTALMPQALAPGSHVYPYTPTYRQADPYPQQRGTPPYWGRAMSRRGRQWRSNCSGSGRWASVVNVAGREYMGWAFRCSLGSPRRAEHLDRGRDLCYDRWGCETGPLFYGGSPVPHRFSGCSSARLERTVRDREVGSSNLPTPTILPLFLLRRATFSKIGPSPT